jgi:hypothetical protein
MEVGILLTGLTSCSQGAIDISRYRLAFNKKEWGTNILESVACPWK